jgi:hypothetical protein
VFLVVAVVVLPVGRAGPAAGGDQGAAWQHGLSALPGDRGEGAVQAGRAGGGQRDDLPGPPADGGGGDAVAAGQAGQPVVAVRLGQPRSSSRLSLARTFSLWRPVTSRPARWAAVMQATGPPTSATASSSDR